MSVQPDQSMLSAFDAGDTTNLDLALPEDGIDLTAQRQVEEYAQEVATGGWEFCATTGDRVNFWNPDGSGVYRIERRKSGWHGVRRGTDVRPNYTDDLQDALDGAGEYMAENPVDREMDE